MKRKFYEMGSNETEITKKNYNLMQSPDRSISGTFSQGIITK